MSAAPIAITTTSQAGQLPSLTVLVYGPAGSGKTYLSRTTGDPSATLILSAEAGLLSLQDVEIPVAQIETVADLQNVYRWLRAGDHPFRWVVLDSLSEIAERILADEKKDKKDGRAAYGEMQDRMVALVRLMRDLPLSVVLIAKQERIQDESGRLLFGPSFPGKRLAQGVAYYVDEVFALIPGDDGEGNYRPRLQTRPDGQYSAKDRSGRLDFFEPASLGHIARKIYRRDAAKDEDQ
jgi:hypothetical protein